RERRRARPDGRALRQRPVRSDDLDVGGLGAFLPLDHVELDCLPLLQVAVALTLDRGEMHEHVGTTLLEDESESLLRAEPLHGSVRDRRSLLPRPGRAWCTMRCPPA